LNRADECMLFRPEGRLFQSNLKEVRHTKIRQCIAFIPIYVIAIKITLVELLIIFKAYRIEQRRLCVTELRRGQRS